MQGEKNRLYFGDNLDVLRRYIKDDSVDLVYLDPPFNSNRNYSVIFNRNGVTDDDAAAQIEAFEDSWKWTHVTDEQYDEFLETGPGRVIDALTAFLSMLGKNDAMAYLVNMAPRLVELHRVLKPTGSLYLHCDPTMSHYLKIMLDAIFDPRNFRSEVIWKRTTSHNSAKRYGPVHDVILYYCKTTDSTWHPSFQAYDEKHLASKYSRVDPATGQRYRDSDLTGAGTREGQSGLPWRGYNPTSLGRHWALPKSTPGDIAEAGKTTQERLDRLDEQGRIHWTSTGTPRLKVFELDAPGVPLGDVWTDISPINSQAAERLGYPTQKPLTLLERILEASSNPDDVVLDPFCGCGTTVDAAQKLGRRWIGIDVTYISIDLIVKRLEHTYGKDITKTFTVTGIPHDVAAARKMFGDSAFEFERWAVTLVGAQPNQKQVGDKGIDGVGRFVLGHKKTEIGKILVSVKGGKTINPSMARDLAGTVQQQGAQLGILVTLEPATKGIQEVVDQSGYWTHPANGAKFPVLQHFTIQELLKGKRPLVPTMYAPYIEAKKQRPAVEQGGLF